MVLITHDNSIAVKAKRIVRLQDGRIIYDGDASDPQAVVQPRRRRRERRCGGMNFTQSFKLAIKSLMLSKMRALLTMLGIIIGVAAVIIITSLGNGMQNYMNAQFEQLGSNLIQVMVYGRGEGGTRDVDTDDMYALVEKYPQYLSGVTPYVSATANVRQGTEDFDRTSVYGVSEAFYRDRHPEDHAGLQSGEGPLPPATSTWSAIRTCASSALIWRRPLSGRIRWVRRSPSAACPTLWWACWRRAATAARAAVTT